jgi:hypothetical protein
LKCGQFYFLLVLKWMCLKMVDTCWYLPEWASNAWKWWSIDHPKKMGGSPLATQMTMAYHGTMAMVEETLCQVRRNLPTWAHAPGDLWATHRGRQHPRDAWTILAVEFQVAEDPNEHRDRCIIHTI